LGEGFPEFERVDDIWDIIDDVDLFVFTDIYQGPLQEYLVRQGKRVFGSRNGDELEIYRVNAKAHFTDLGISQNAYEVVTGIKALRSYIKSRGDDKLWIKISRTRGDMETFSVEGYDLAKNRLDTIESRLGPIAAQQLFVVEENLPDTYDIAIDTFSIDGQYPDSAMLGIEAKDEGYVCVVKDWAAMPPALVDVYDKIAPTLESFQYRNLVAFESRVGANGLWLSDPCCRFGSPVSELELELVENIAEIIWEGADGVLVQPKYRAKYGCEALITSKWAVDRPLLIQYPEEYRDNIKLRYSSQFGDETWILPQHDLDETEVAIGAIVAYGDNLDDCMEQVKEIGEQVKGTQVCVTSDSMDVLKGNIETLGSWGIKF